MNDLDYLQLALDEAIAAGQAGDPDAKQPGFHIPAAKIDADDRNGWRQQSGVTAFDMIRELEPYCDSFLYTHIDTEGLMGGIPMDTVTAIRRATPRHLVVAGGIREQSEIDSLDKLGIDAVVGMALYEGKIQG